MLVMTKEADWKSVYPLVLYGCLGEHSEMKQILSYTEVSAF
jgi:hypothetical protein